MRGKAGERAHKKDGAGEVIARDSSQDQPKILMWSLHCQVRHYDTQLLQEA